jgi:hypothetical protein
MTPITEQRRSAWPKEPRRLGLTPFPEQLHNAGFSKRGRPICTYFDENFFKMVPAEHIEGLYSCLDHYQAVSDPFSKELLHFTAGGACTGLYRGLRLWEAAVKEAGSLGNRYQSA